MKKLLIITLLLIVLVGCQPKKEEYYNLTIEDTTIAVGYDSVNTLNGLHINSYTSHLDKKDNEIIDSIELYVEDLNNKDIYLDDYKLTNIKKTCSDLSGELVNNNGNSCALHKFIKDDTNIVILYGNILNGDNNLIERIEAIYK